jgi:HlyD family secretion protein
MVEGRAAETPIAIGHRNDHVAEVLEGLQPGDVVVLHPSDRVTGGAKVAQRVD